VLWGPSHSDITVPSSVEEVLQNTPVQRLKGGNPTTALPSGRRVAPPREIQVNITVKPQCKDNRTANIISVIKGKEV